jgi:hypothetical protein
MALSKIDVANMVTGATPITNGGTGLTTNVSRRNATPLIINGDMHVAQRGTSSTGVSTSSYQTCDRMQIVLSNLGTYTIIQEDLSSGDAYNNGFKHAWRIDTTTADASPGSADLAIFRYKFEGQDVQVFKKGASNAETYTLAFWVKSNKTGVGQVNLSDTDNTRMCSATYTISSADTWEHKVLNYAADTTGAFGNDNAVSLQIDWFLDSGSNFEGGSAPTAWEAQSDGDRNASGNLNIGDNTANDWAITGIQLEVGTFSSTTLPPFQFESFGDNLARCQRYCQVYKTESAYGMMSPASVNSASAANGIFTFPTYLRAIPSLSTSGSFGLYSGDGGDAVSGIVIDANSDDASRVVCTISGSGFTDNSAAFLRAENDSDAKMTFDAEL